MKKYWEKIKNGFSLILSWITLTNNKPFKLSPSNRVSFFKSLGFKLFILILLSSIIENMLFNHLVSIDRKQEALLSICAFLVIIILIVSEIFLYNSPKLKRIGGDSLLFALIIFITAPFVTNFIVNSVFSNDDLEFIRDLIIGKDEVWISFFGSLFGGVLTMGVVYFTVKYENEKAREERIHQSRPLITVELTKGTSSRFLSIDEILIRNVSNSPARGLTITRINHCNINSDSEIKNKINCTVIDSYTSNIQEYLLSKEEQKFNLYYTRPPGESTQINNYIEITLQYSDFNRLRKYTTRVYYLYTYSEKTKDGKTHKNRVVQKSECFFSD